MPGEFNENIPREYREGEKQVETKVILEIMRHGEKEIAHDKSNEEIRLSEKGRNDAIEKGERRSPDINSSVAWGGDKKRTQETAALVMLANEITDGKLDSNASLEEINETVNKGLGFGKKIGIDNRLSFYPNGPTGPDLQKSFKEQRLLNYLLEDSDKLAIEKVDKTTSTYSRFA